MDNASIARVVALFDQSSLTELEYSEDSMRLRLVRSASGSTLESRSSVDPSSTRSVPPMPLVRPAPLKSDSHSIVAGLSGTFYRRPSPDQPLYAEASDRIEEGQTIGIIEAMKMLNEVEADHSGRIVRFVIEDGAPVEAGATIAILKSIESDNV